MTKSSKFSPEVRERAVLMVQEQRSGHPSLWAALESIAPKIGCVPQTLLNWLKRAEVDSGMRKSVTRNETRRVKELEREVKELRWANEILRPASTFFTHAELDRRTRFTRSPSELLRWALVARAIWVHRYLPSNWEHRTSPNKTGVSGRFQAIFPLPRRILTLPIEGALEELGFVIGMQHKTQTFKVYSGYECILDGYRATGSSWGEAIVRASLLKFEAEGGRS